MLHRSARVLSTLALAACAVLGLRAATPAFWTVATQTALLAGDITNLSVDHLGRLMLGPTLEPVYESTAPFLWSIVTDDAGAIYVGSGNEGRVYEVTPDGEGRIFFDADELESHALAFGPDGSLYVGTSPDGRVYRIAPDGTAAPFFDPEDRYIWALVFDAQGNLYVGTGEAGTIYRVTPDGSGSVFYATLATHAVALAFDPDGNLLAGTDSPGKLFRIDANGRGFVLLDSPFAEIHSISRDARGDVFVTALNDAGNAGGSRPAVPSGARPAGGATTSGSPSAGVTTEVTVVAAAPSSTGASNQGSAAATSSRGAVYRITRNGVWDLLWESGQDLPYDVSFDDAGEPVVATGPEGKIYRLSGDPVSAALLARADVQQITAFHRTTDGTTYFATANPGKLVRLADERADRGTYESAIHDAGTVAGWGIISWRAIAGTGGRVEIFTRSGNTPSPDATWSDWAGPYRNARGEPIRSPTARYLQWKADLSGRDANPVLTSVTAAYLPKNSRPTVESITVHPPGIVFQQPFPTGDPPIAGLQQEPPDRQQLDSAGGAAAPGVSQPALGRRAYEKGFQTFVWRARDDDHDELSYTLSYRLVDDPDWKVLKSGLTDTIYVWDTTSVRDGTYLVKLAASDLPSNAPDRALVGELESGLFDIDNTPPEIQVTGLRPGPPPTLLFDVHDAQSTLQRVEYSRDARDWKALYPVDGIADSPTEAFELPLDAADASVGVILRAVDTANNAATARGVPPAGR